MAQKISVTPVHVEETRFKSLLTRCFTTLSNFSFGFPTSSFDFGMETLKFTNQNTYTHIITKKI